MCLNLNKIAYLTLPNKVQNADGNSELESSIKSRIFQNDIRNQSAMYFLLCRFAIWHCIDYLDNVWNVYSFHTLPASFRHSIGCRISYIASNIMYLFSLFNCNSFFLFFLQPRNQEEEKKQKNTWTNSHWKILNTFRIIHSFYFVNVHKENQTFLHESLLNRISNKANK